MPAQGTLGAEVSGAQGARSESRFPNAVCIRLDTRHRVLAEASVALGAEPEPAAYIQVVSDDPRLLGALEAGRRRFAISHVWQSGSVRAHVRSTSLRASIVGGVAASSVRATLIPEYPPQIEFATEADAVEFLAANLPTFRRSMAARTHQDLDAQGLMLEWEDFEVFVNPVAPIADQEVGVPRELYRHAVRLQRRQGRTITANDSKSLLRVINLFLHFMCGRGTYPAVIRQWRDGRVAGSTLGPLHITRGVGPASNELTLVGHWCEYLEPTFADFAVLFGTEAGHNRIAEALRWRDTAATNGVASVRITAAYTALEQLGLLFFTRQAGSTSHMDRPVGSERRFDTRLNAADKIGIALHRVCLAHNPWFSPAYSRLAALADRMRWSPSRLIAELRQRAVHAENHAKFAPYSHVIADLASDFAVDAFNAAILCEIGFRGTLPPRAAPFDAAAGIRFPMVGMA